jgi:uncharacterized membrane protein YqhA
MDGSPREPAFFPLVESLLWRSRVLMVVPAIGSVLLAITALALGTLDALLVLVRIVGYLIGFGASSATSDPVSDLIAGAIAALDIYLLSAILFIFGFGLYELFIGKIEVAEQSPTAPRVLVIHSLDDLKDRLAKVALLALVIEFLREALRLHFTSVLDLLYLAGGILAIGIAIYLALREAPRREG